MSARLRRAAVVAVGDELLAGAYPDTNSPFLSRELARIGIALVEVRVVGDREELIAAAAEELLASCELVLLTGGIGPTLDDVTRHAAARVLGVELVESPETLAELEAWWSRRGAPMPGANRRQALIPAGATRIPNRVGTAPGFRAERDGRDVLVLPGPPRELSVVFEEQVLPWLIASGRAAEPIGEHRFFLFGLSESAFADEVGAWMERDADPLICCTASGGLLSIVLRARGADLGALEERVAAFRGRFARHVFSEHEPRLEHVLAAELLERRVSVAVAESCTGGLVAGLLTEVPGISAVFRAAFVTYADETKARLLGVPKRLLARRGAVSSEVAAAMAEGAAAKTGAELAIAVTGIAGPSGGTPEKPVGLVWFATTLSGATETVERRYPPGERAWIRTLAARNALHLALQRLRARAD